MKLGKDTIPDVFNWLVHASVTETKSAVSKASVETLERARREVEGVNKGKADAIRRELCTHCWINIGEFRCRLLDNGKECKFEAKEMRI